MTMSRSVWGREETGSVVAGQEQPFPGELLLLKSLSGGTRGATQCMEVITPPWSWAAGPRHDKDMACLRASPPSTAS